MSLHIANRTVAAREYVAERWLELSESVRSVILGMPQVRDKLFREWEMQFWQQEYDVMAQSRDHWKETAEGAMQQLAELPS
ncbi:MAG: hypothetical protein ACYTAS_19140 [Planctomycetota bacterium]|jgi:hypothetical protein